MIPALMWRSDFIHETYGVPSAERSPMRLAAILDVPGLLSPGSATALWESAVSADPTSRQIDALRPVGGSVTAARSTPMPWRSLLVVGCMLAAALPLVAVDPAADAFEPELARLLRGMALLKATFVLTAVAILLWRLAQPVATATAVLYLGGTWAGAAATTMIWQLDRLVLASTLFHVGLIAFLIVAMRDGILPSSWSRRG